MDKKKIFDWKFIVAICLFMAVSYIIFVGISAVKQVDDLVVANKELSSVNEKQLRIAATERRVSNRERARLFRYTKELAVRQRQIYRYLLNHGIELPERLLDPIAVPPQSNPNPPGGQNGGDGNNNGNKPGNRPKGLGEGNGPGPVRPTDNEDALVCVIQPNLEPLCI